MEAMQKVQTIVNRVENRSDFELPKLVNLKDRANQAQALGVEEATKILVDMQQNSMNVGIVGSCVKKGVNLITELTK